MKIRPGRRYELEHRVRTLRPALRRKRISERDHKHVQELIEHAMTEVREVFGVHEVQADLNGKRQR